MTQKITRINQIAKENEKEVFTSIYHLINKDLLRECYKELDGNRAVGIDEVTKTAEAFSPKDRSSLGIYKTTKKAHKELAVKSSCPSFLKNRIKVK